MKRKEKWKRFLACMLAMVLCITTINTNAFLLEVHAEETESVSENDSADVNLQEIPALEEAEPVMEETKEESVTEEAADEEETDDAVMSQEEAVIPVGNPEENLDNEDVPVYSACMLGEEEALAAATEGRFPENVPDAAWVGADTLEGIFTEVALKWENGPVSENEIQIPYTGYLLIILNKSVREETEISIPETINDEPLSSIVIWAYDQSISMPGVSTNIDRVAFRGGTIEGNLPICFAGSSGEIRLEDITVNGSVYACGEEQSELSEPAGQLILGNNVTLGGIYDINKITFNGDLRIADVAGADRVEFHQIQTNRHNYTIVFEGYRDQKLPQFHQGVNRNDYQKACEYKMIIDDRNKYPVKWYQDTLYVKKDDKFYRVWEYDQAVCLEEGNEPVSEDEIDWEKSKDMNIRLIDSLEEEFANPDDEKYVTDGVEYPVYRFWDLDNRPWTYLLKNGLLYWNWDNTNFGIPDLQDTALATVQDTGQPESVLTDQLYRNGLWGGLAEIPNLTVRYLTPESFDGEWQDVALPYETQVINYISPGILREVEDFSYWQERWDGTYNADDAYVDVDGVVYNRQNAIADVECFVRGTITVEGEQVRLETDQESFEQCGRGYYCTEEVRGEFASISNAILAMKDHRETNGGEGYYRLRLRNNIKDVSLAIPKYDIAGIAVEADWDDWNNQPNRVALHAIKLKNDENFVVKFINLYVGSEKENVSDPAQVTITGKGKVIFQDCKINETVECVEGSEIEIDLLGSNTMKNLIMPEGTTLTYAEGGSVLGIEDFMDAKDAVIKGDIRLAARKDARIVLGTMDTLTGYHADDEGRLPAGSSIEFYAETENGESTDFVLTKNFELGYSRDPEAPEIIYKNSLNLRMLDAKDENCVFSNSMYGVNSCFYVESEEYQYKNENYDDSYNLVTYDPDSVQKILTISKALYDDKETDKVDLFEKIHAVYKEALEEEGYQEIWCYNMGFFADEVTNEESICYGKPVFTEVGNEIRYLMYTWTYDEAEESNVVSVDANKYVSVLKEVDLSKAEIAAIEEQTYTGNAITPSVTVTLNGSKLIQDKDFVVDYTNNINPGTATVTITGINDYSGENSVNFTIKKKEEPQKPQEPEKPHTHTKGEWVIEKDATGSETGTKVQKCTVCGEVLGRETIPKYKVTLNVKSVPLQVKKSTTAVKATVMDGDKVVSWKSSNTKVATVTKTGKISGKKEGKATITVTTAKGAKASVKVTVQKSQVKTSKVKVDKKSLTLKPKKSYRLKVTLIPVTSSEGVKFTSSNTKVATVDKTGKIKAKKAGKATITIKSGKKKATVKVTVKK